jgi:hypothetical protein
VFKQELHDVYVSLDGCPLKGGIIGSALVTDVGATFKQELHDVYVSLEGCDLKVGTIGCALVTAAAFKQEPRDV